jgi:hypothetical protein
LVLEEHLLQKDLIQFLGLTQLKAVVMAETELEQLEATAEAVAAAAVTVALEEAPA